MKTILMLSAVDTIINAIENKDIDRILYQVITIVRNLTLTKIFPLLVVITVIQSVYKFNLENERLGIGVTDVVKIFVTCIFLYLSPQFIFTIDKLSNGIMVAFPKEKSKVMVNASLGRDEYMLNMKRDALASASHQYGFTPEETEELEGILSSAVNVDQVNSLIIDFAKGKNKMTPQNKSFFSWSTLKDILMDANSVIQNAASLVLTSAYIGVLQSIFLVVSFIMGMLIYTFFILLACLAPLAIAFNLVFPGITVKWLQALLVAKFSFLTFAIIETVVFSLLAHDFGQNANLYYVNTGMLVTSIVCYLMTFWFTSKYVGGEAAGQFLSKVGTLATMLASGGANKIAGGVKQIVKKGG